MKESDLDELEKTVGRTTDGEWSQSGGWMASGQRNLGKCKLSEDAQAIVLLRNHAKELIRMARIGLVEEGTDRTVLGGPMFTRDEFKDFLSENGGKDDEPDDTTDHLLSSEVNAKRLQESVEQLDRRDNNLKIAVEALEYCADPDFDSPYVGQDYVSYKTVIVAETALEKIQANGGRG